MKFKFKIQQYQTDAVERTVEVFSGQPSVDSLAYRRDLGKHAATLYDDELEMGYRNSEVQLTSSQLLENIHKAQAAGDIKLSLPLVSVRVVSISRWRQERVRPMSISRRCSS